MKLVNLTKTIETALLSGIVIAFATGGALSERIEKKGKTSYVTTLCISPVIEHRRSKCRQGHRAGSGWSNREYERGEDA